MGVAHRQLAARSGQSSMSKKAFHCFAGTSPDSAEIESGEIQSLREGEANERADIINSVIEELICQDYSTLNDLAERIHAESQEAIFNLVVTRTPVEVIHKLKDLLDTDFGRRQSDFNTLKQSPKKPSRKHLEVLIDHLA